MRIHHTLRNKPLGAQPTNVRPFSRMRALVYFKRRPLRKSLPAILANIRLLTGMNALVLLQLLLSRKTFRTQTALVRLVPRVDSAMELELLLARKSLAADVAQDRHVDAVLVVLAEFVALQARRGGVVLVAYRAVVFDEGHARHDLPVLGASVRREEPGEHEVLPANLALKRLLAGMKVLVFDSVGADGKCLVAYLAFVFGVALVCADVHFEVIL